MTYNHTVVREVNGSATGSGQDFGCDPLNQDVTRPYVWMLCGCAWFSVMALLTSTLRNDCDWQIIAMARSALAALLALGLALVLRAPLVWFRPRMIWLRSIAGSCSMICTFYALTRLPTSDVLTLTNTFPVWVALLAWPMTGERPTLGVWFAVLCAVVGVAMTQQPHVSGISLATVSALVASFFTAVAMLGLNRLHGVSSLGVVVHFSTVSTLFCAAAYFVFDRVTGHEQLGDFHVLLRLFGVGATATVGQVFLTLAFRSGSATKVSVVGLSQVVMVMAIEAILQWREFNTLSILGTILVLGPTAWLMTRPRPVPPKTDEPPVEEVAIE